VGYFLFFGAFDWLAHQTNLHLCLLRRLRFFSHFTTKMFGAKPDFCCILPDI